MTINPYLVTCHQWKLHWKLLLFFCNCMNSLFYSCEFSTSSVTGGFHWNLRDGKDLKLFRTLSTWVDLNNAVVYGGSIFLLIFSSSSFFSWFFETVPRASTIFYNFFSSLARSRYLPSFLLSFCRIIITTLAGIGVPTSVQLVDKNKSTQNNSHNNIKFQLVFIHKYLHL